MTRTQIYIGVSALLANVVLLRAYYERPNFYSAAVYVSQSNGSLMLLLNLAIIVAVCFGYALQRLFYGPLRPIETEQLYEKAWFAVSETLLAMTIFRDDIGVWFFAMFLGLLGGRVWQWIAEGRVEYLEQQPPANPRLFHARLSASLLLSVFFDAFMVRYCVDTILQTGRPGMMAMFAFEYAILFIVSMSTLARYTLSLVELAIIHRQTQASAEARRIARERRAQEAAQQTSEGEAAEPPVEDEDDDDDDVPGWEEKGRWVFYFDLLTDFIKSVVYIGFFLMLIAFHGIPIHIMRDLFMTLRSFIKRVNDFIQYRNATRDMNSRYPDATAEDLERENTCIVCREEMRVWVEPGANGAEGGANRRVDERQRPKKLPCGHILHFSCLRSWLERQQVCPTCRRPVLTNSPPQPNQANNPANPGQQNGVVGNGGNGLGLFGLGNQQQPQGGQQGAPGQGGAQQPDRPAANMRVFNFGPIRIALGNIRVPANPANPNARNEALANLQQRLAQAQHQAALNVAQAQHQAVHQAALNAAQNQAQNTGPAGTHTYTLPGVPAAGIPAGAPGSIQADVLRIQDNMANTMRHLQIQYTQLEYIQTLLGEINRLQQAAGTTANGQPLPTATVPAQWGPAGLQQAYLPTQGNASMGPGDPNLPAGLVLPEGWSIRRLTHVSPVSEQQSSTVQQPAQPAQPEALEPSTAPPQTDTAPSSSQPPSSTPAPHVGSGSSDTSTPKGKERASEPQNWGFSNVVGGTVEAGGSSSAFEGQASSAGTTSRRTATVEDDEDEAE